MRIFSACSKLFLSIRFKIYLILFLEILLFPSAVFALSANQYPVPTGGDINKALEVIPVGRLLPDSPLYFLISVKEVFARLFQPSAAQRANFDFVLAGKRLKESYLMLEKGKVNLAASNLIGYQQRLQVMTKQLEKARSQNQDLAKQVSKISDDFIYHQTLLLAIISTGAVNDSVDGAINGFLDAVSAVDKINPGIKNRYKILRGPDNIEPNQTGKAAPSPIISHFPMVATPSSSPRRIIY